LTEFGQIIYFRFSCGNLAAPREKPAVQDAKWSKLDDDALEKLLLERWLFRGVLIVVMLAGAVMTTYLGGAGLPTLVDRLAVSALVCITLSAGGIALAMRGTDLRIHRELRRRRSAASRVE
jgi:hypothetical protein